MDEIISYDDEILDVMKDYNKLLESSFGNLRKIGYYIERGRLEVLKYQVLEMILKHMKAKGLESPMAEYELKKIVGRQAFIDYRVAGMGGEDDDDILDRQAEQRIEALKIMKRYDELRKTKTEIDG